MDEETYYLCRKPELLKEFDEDVERWRPVVAGQYGSGLANAVLRESREAYEALIPHIPYVGGDESWTGSLVEAVRCLALYQAMKKHGKTAGETGKILYDAVLARTPSALWATERLMERRKKRAERSQERRYAADYVCELVVGDGIEFDYGYDFTECASQKFYHAQGADEFLPFFCFLDYAYSKVSGEGLTRTMTLSEGHPKCNHRFKRGRRAELDWPPPFLK